MSDYVLARGREEGPERESGLVTERDRSARQLVPAEQKPPELRKLFPARWKGRAADQSCPEDSTLHGCSLRWAGR